MGSGLHTHLAMGDLLVFDVVGKLMAVVPFRESSNFLSDTSLHGWPVMRETLEAARCDCACRGDSASASGGLAWQTEPLLRKHGGGGVGVYASSHRGSFEFLRVSHFVPRDRAIERELRATDVPTTPRPTASPYTPVPAFMLYSGSAASLQTVAHQAMPPSLVPTLRPTHAPMLWPSLAPSGMPTAVPTLVPTRFSSSWPTAYYSTLIHWSQRETHASRFPTLLPSSTPTPTPTAVPTFFQYTPPPAPPPARLPRSMQRTCERMTTLRVLESGVWEWMGSNRTWRQVPDQLVLHESKHVSTHASTHVITHDARWRASCRSLHMAAQ